jgi:hypothetical protein
MKRSKSSFGYELTDGNVRIEAVNLVFGIKVLEKYKVTDLKTDRVISTKSIKSARVIASDFEEYYKIYNRNKKV